MSSVDSVLGISSPITQVITPMPFWRRALRSAGYRLFHYAENNGLSDFDRNGEAWLIGRVIANASKPVIFDVGGYIGDYTRCVLEQAKQAQKSAYITIFEPSPENLAILHSRFVLHRNVAVVQAAVADIPGWRVLYSEELGSNHGSLVRRSMFEPSIKESVVPVERLDDYMEGRHIKHIDLLKLDIEGCELVALRSLGNRLNPSIVKAIQFEYGDTTKDAGASLAELYRELTARGYSVGKLFPRHVEFRPYQAWLMEHYTYANYVAVSPELCGLL